MKIDNVEVFATGVWNGRRYTIADLDGMVAAFAELALAGKLPAKLGHDAADTEPAQGWITALRRAGNQLIATIDQVPAELVAEIKQGRWRFVSIELLQDVRHAGKVHPFVPDALAILGSRRPAVNVLEGLHRIVCAAVPGLAYGERLAFSHDMGDDTDPEAQQIAETRADLRDLAAQTTDPAKLRKYQELLDALDKEEQDMGERQTFSAESARLRAENQQLQRQLRAADSREARRTLEHAVSSEHIYPETAPHSSIALAPT